MAAALAWPSGSVASPAGSAVVQEILDGRELFIERRQAQVQERAFTPELVHTQKSRGEQEVAALEALVQHRFPGVIAAAPPRPALSRDPLVETINRYRAQGGRPDLKPLPADLATQNAAYLVPVLEGVLNSRDCDHDRSSWGAFQERMAASGGLMPTSEVIACPMPAAAWNPELIVSRWMGSALHTQILINRPKARAIDCVRLERSGRAVAICTLWSPVPR